MESFPYWLSFLEGILTFISPCILPLLPIYFVYLAGVAGEDANGRLIINSIAFVIGLTLVFTTLGATATTLGSFLKDNIVVFRQLSGLIMIILGLNFMGLFRLSFLNMEKRFDYDVKDLNFIKSIVFGMVFAFGWTPCVGVFLGSALLMASNSNSLGQGILLLLTYSAGLGLPFIVSAILFNRINTTLKTIQRYYQAITIFSGLVLVVAGILLIIDKLAYLF